MAKVLGEILVDIEKCKGCELCVEACPEKAMALSDKINQKGYHYAIRLEASCNGCAACAIMCPEAIIKVYRKVIKTPKTETVNS